MSTFENIRKISPYLFGFFAVMLVAFFTIGDQTVVDGLTNSGNPADRVIARVNDEAITYEMFERRVRDVVEQQRQQAEQQGRDYVEDDARIRMQVWNDLVEEKLLFQAAAEAGIKITDDRIRDIMIENPPDFIKQAYTDSTGTFMRDIYLQIVTNPENAVNYMGDPTQMTPEQRAQIIQQFRDDLLNIEDYIRRQQLTNKLINLVNSSNGVISNLYARNKFKIDRSTADINYISAMAKDIKDDEVQISDGEIADYYDAHKKMFAVEEGRRIRFSAFRVQPNKDDSLRAQRKVTRLLESIESVETDAQRDSVFEVKIAEYGGVSHDFGLVNDINPQKYGYMALLDEGQIAGPIMLQDGTYFLRLDGRQEGENEVIKAKHILIGFGEPENKDSAKAYAAKLIRDIKGGTSFEAAAREHSIDQGSGAQGGELGYFGKGRMVPEFEKAAFAANTGDIVGPVETQFGYHIIKVEDKKSEEIAYSEIHISPNMSSKTKRLLFMEANSLKEQVKKGANFEEVSEKLGLRSDETQFFTKENPMLGSQYLTDMVFKAKKGDVLEPIEIDRFGIVVVQVIDVRSEGYASLDEVKEEIRQKVLKIKKLDMAKGIIETKLAALKSAGGFAEAQANNSDLDIKQATNVKINGNISAVGTDPIFTAKIFEVPMNQIEGPLRGENGYYVFEVYNRSVPNDETIESALLSYKEQLAQMSANQTFTAWFQDYKKKAKIEDNRSEFYKEY